MQLLACLRYMHHLMGCGSNKQVIKLRSEGLGVPLGGSRGLGSASGGLERAWECFWGALGGLWLQNSLSAQNSIIRSNLINTGKYVINTIRRIIRLCRMTHPWCKPIVSPSFPAACMLPCIASICDMHSTLQRNIMWIAYTPVESLQIQEVSFTCCL